MNAREYIDQLKDQIDRGTPVTREQLDRLTDAVDAKPAAEHVADPPADEGAETDEADDAAEGQGSARRRRRT
jgi:hypothetical protein